MSKGSSGSALPGEVQAKMEAAFATDFSAVRVHEDSSAAAMGMRAFTRGTDVHFAPGEMAPGTPAGQELIGHELTHVVQQAEGRVSAPSQAEGAAINADPALEAEADRQGERAARGEQVRSDPVVLGDTQGAIQAKGELPIVLELQVKNVLSMQGDGEISKARATMLRAIVQAFHRKHRQILLRRFGQPTPGDELAQLFLKLPTKERADAFAALADQEPARTEEVPADKKDGRVEPGEAPATAMPGRDDPAMWKQTIGETSIPVGKIARVGVPKGLRLHSAPDVSSTTQSILTIDTLVHVERKTTHGWSYVVVLGDSINGGPTSGVGFVEDQFLAYDPPEPAAHLHWVKGGEKLKDIAGRYYEPKGGFPKGKDARLYVEALYEVNKARNAVYVDEVDLGFAEEAIRPEAAEETGRIWEGVGVRTNHALWLPSMTLITRMKSMGTITSGSRTREALRWIGKNSGSITEQEGTWKAGFVLGLAEGIYAAGKDLVMGVVDLAKLIGKLVLEVVEKGTDALVEFGKKVVEAFKKLPEALQMLAKWFVDGWTREDPFDRGEFQGEVIGYIAFQVLLLVLTFGESAAAQIGGRFANVIKVVRALDAAADPFFYAGQLRKMVKVGREITDKVRQGRKVVGKGEDVIGEAGDAAGDRARGMEQGSRDGEVGREPRNTDSETHTRSIDDQPHDRRDFHNELEKMSPSAQQAIRQLEKQGWVALDKIDPYDLVDISKWFGKEIGVVQSPYGKLRLLLGTKNGVLTKQLFDGEVFVVHTHPVMRSMQHHFDVDLPNAGERVEAVIDWGGQVTYYNKSGIKNPIRPDGSVEPLRGYQAAFLDADGNIIGFGKVDVLDVPGGSVIKVNE